MQKRFGPALEWHLKHIGPDTLADLVRASGVSRHALTKVQARPGASTDVENVAKIAEYYGKSIEQFLNCEEVGSDDKAQALFAILKPSEKRQAEKHIRILIEARKEQEPS